MNGLSHCHWLQCHPNSAKLFNQSANSLSRGNKKSALSLWKLFSVTVLSYFVLLSPSPVDAQQSSTYEECRLYLAISDLDQNDSLDSDPEYIRFLNQWSRQRFGDTVFQELPAALQSNFQPFADPATGEINIRGTKPGNIPTQEEMERLEQFCDATEAALDGNAGGPQSQPTLPPSTPRPTYAPGVPTPAPIYQRTTFEECLIYMAISDSTRDNLLSASEYVTFINNLGNLDYTTFNSLPVVIQLTYNNLSDRRDINIDGARLGEIVSQEQSAYLKRVCDDTELAIISALGGGGLPTPNRPTLAPATLPPAIIVPTNPPIIPTAPPFIPTIAPLPVMTPPPSTSEPVPTASGDTPQPTSAQPISGQLPTAPPIVTAAPIASIVIPPGDGRVTINAAFIIASAAGFVTKEELENPNDRNRRGLATAFDLMVRDLLGSRSMPGSMSVSMPSTTEGARNSSSSNETAVEDALNEMSTGVPGVGTRRVQEESHTHTTTFRQQSSSPQLHPLHGRKLTIFFIPGGSDIFSVEDIDCDANLPSEAVCHKIFAGYELQATADEDLQLLYNQLVPATQNYIDQGELQKQLTIVDPTSDLSVVRSSYPVEWITSPPTASPKDGDDDDKERYILIGSIGGALFLILMASLILAIGCYCCQRNSVPTTGRKVIPSTAGPSRVRMSKSTRPTQVQVPLVDQQAYPTEVFRDEEYGPEDEETSEEFGTFQIVDTTPPPPKLPTKGKPLVGKQIKPIAPTKQQPTIETPVPVDYEEEVVQEVFEDEPVADTGEAPWESESESSEDEGPPPPPPPPPTQTREAASNVQETEMETAEKHESIEAPVSTESKPVIAGAGEEVKVAEVAKSEMEKIADQPVNDESKVGEPKEEEPKPEEKGDVGETTRKVRVYNLFYSNVLSLDCSAQVAFSLFRRLRGKPRRA